MLYLANKALHINDLKNNITMHTIPGTGGMYHGGWYWLVDEKGTNKLLKELALIPTPGNEAAAAPAATNLENTVSNNDTASQ
jgi:anionic cell wall polymer biosynthesis LytR-Cps2A-Psr (LCP) family protein